MFTQMSQRRQLGPASYERKPGDLEAKPAVAWHEMKTANFSLELAKHNNQLKQQDSFSKTGFKRSDPDEMTADARQAIIDSKFDYAMLSSCISDIRKSFWKIDTMNDFFKSKVKQTHNHFFKAIIPGRTEKIRENRERLNKGGFISALGLVDPKKKHKIQHTKNNEIRFDSGSERSSMQEDRDSVLENLAMLDVISNSSLVVVDETYEPNVKSDRADRINAFQKQKTQLMSIASMDKASQMALDINNVQNQHQPVLNQMTALSGASKDQLKKSLQKRKTFVHKSKKTSARRKQTRQDSVQDGAGVNSVLQETDSSSFYRVLSDQQFQTELMSNSDLSRITFTLFEQKMKDPDIKCELALKLSRYLQDQFQLQYDFEDLKVILSFVDKSLFLTLRSGKVTLAQLRARVAERRGLCKYKVFDDIYADLNQDQKKQMKNQPNRAEIIFGKNPDREQYSKELELWQADPKCIRSIEYDHKKSRKQKSKLIVVTQQNSSNKMNLQESMLNETIKSMESTALLQQREINKTLKDIGLKAAKSIDKPQQKQTNSLVDEKSLKSKQARLNKEQELRKHKVTVESLKKSLAKQIVNKTLNIEEFKQLTINDLFKHAADIDASRAKKKKEDEILRHGQDQEKDKMLDERMESRIQGNIQASVSRYSSRYELQPGLTEEQADLMRLKNKMNDPYRYYQERQNQIEKAYELMNVYKTVYQIEKEIKQAQTYLSMADQYYSKQGGRGSPTKSEYDYIKRLVDDGEPVVLTKKIRKALKIKDETEDLTKAMNEDLKDAGINEDEKIDQSDLNFQQMEMSSDDSADVRKRKALQSQNLKDSQGNPQITNKISEKQVSKAQKAKMAFRAERERQKILRPSKSRDSNGTFIQQKSQQRRIQTANHRKERLSKKLEKKDAYVVATTFSVDEPSQNRDTVHTELNTKQQLEYFEKPKIQSSHTNLLFNKENQKSFVNKRRIESAKVVGKNNYACQKQSVDPENRKIIDDQQEHHMDFLASHSAIDESMSSSGKRITVKRPLEIKTNVNDGQSRNHNKRQIRSAFTLKTLKKFHQTSRSVTNNNVRQQSEGVDEIDFYQQQTSAEHHQFQNINYSKEFEEESEEGGILSQQNSEDRNRIRMAATSWTSSQFHPIRQQQYANNYHQNTNQNEQLENSMSHDMLDFVNTYGITVQKAAAVAPVAAKSTKKQLCQMNLLGNQSQPVSSTRTRDGVGGSNLIDLQIRLKNTRESCAVGVQKRQQRQQSAKPTAANRYQQTSGQLTVFSGMSEDSKSQYAGATNFTSVDHQHQPNIYKGRRAHDADICYSSRSQPYPTGRPARAMTAAHYGQRKIHNKRQRRQDLDFDAKQEDAETKMKEQKLLLFQNKLERNNLLQSTTYSSSLNMSSQEHIIKSQEQARQVAAQIVAQVDKKQSSDYNTKAIATRLQSIAQRRIQTATLNHEKNLQQQHNRVDPSCFNTVAEQASQSSLVPQFIKKFSQDPYAAAQTFNTENSNRASKIANKFQHQKLNINSDSKQSKMSGTFELEMSYVKDREAAADFLSTSGIVSPQTTQGSKVVTKQIVRLSKKFNGSNGLALQNEQINSMDFDEIPITTGGKKKRPRYRY